MHRAWQVGSSLLAAQHSLPPSLPPAPKIDIRICTYYVPSYIIAAVHICLYIQHMYIPVHTYIYIYTYIYTHTHIRTYIHTYSIRTVIHPSELRSRLTDRRWRACEPAFSATSPPHSAPPNYIRRSRSWRLVSPLDRSGPACYVPSVIYIAH